MIKLLLIIMLLLSTSVIMAQSDDDILYPTDEWAVSSPVAQNIDADRLADTIARIPEEHSHITSLLIVRNSQLVVEEYFNGNDSDSLIEVFSVTKSVTSALVGMAIGEGDLSGLGMTLAEGLPSYFTDGQNSDKADITLNDLLLMRSGIGWDEALNALRIVTANGDLTEYVLEIPMSEAPGESWTYSSGNSQLISALFTEQVGMTMADYARDNLFAPLGISNFEWQTDGIGNNIGGAGLRLSAQDLAKFGYLFLQNGKWEDGQIIPDDWVELTTTTFIEDKEDYSYHWWLTDYSYNAEGFAGQYVTVIPEADVVIVLTSNPSFFQAQQQSDSNRDFIEQLILPTIEDN